MGGCSCLAESCAFCPHFPRIDIPHCVYNNTRHSSVTVLTPVNNPVLVHCQKLSLLLHCTYKKSNVVALKEKQIPVWYPLYKVIQFWYTLYKVIQFWYPLYKVIQFWYPLQGILDLICLHCVQL